MELGLNVVGREDVRRLHDVAVERVRARLNERAERGDAHPERRDRRTADTERERLEGRVAERAGGGLGGLVDGGERVHPAVESRAPSC